MSQQLKDGSSDLGHHLRRMVRRDMADVLTIEQNCFEWPWTEDEFVRALRQMNCIGEVAEDLHTGRVSAFMVYELHKAHIHLVNFAVRKTLWRQGVGRTMLAELLRKLSAVRRCRITLEVRETNVAAQKFWRAMGFRAQAILRKYYPQEETEEDAYVFSYHLCAAATKQPKEVACDRAK